MAAIQNEADLILQATSPRFITSPLPPNVAVPNMQVVGLGDLALLSVAQRLQVQGLGYAAGYVNFLSGEASGTIYHYSGRKVLPIFIINYDLNYPIVGIYPTDITDDYFTWRAYAFSATGGGHSGTRAGAWGYL